MLLVLLWLFVLLRVLACACELFVFTWLFAVSAFFFRVSSLLVFVVRVCCVISLVNVWCLLFGLLLMCCMLFVACLSFFCVCCFV